MTRGRQQPRELIENRISFAGPSSELSIYDTYLPAEKVGLTAGELLYAGMINGRKTIYGAQGFEADLLPHETFVMAPGQHIEIDFPEASLECPTTCLTIEIARERVDEICSRLNADAPLQREFEEWRFHPESLIHTPHSAATQALLQRLVATFTEQSHDRDLLIDLGIDELLVRMLRTQTRGLLLSTCAQNPEINGLGAALHHMQQHLAQSLDIDELCKIACMSRSRFFSEFKKHMGCTPQQFQQQQRMAVARERLQKGESISRVCFDLGYRNLSHFSRRFQMQFGSSPKQFQHNHTEKQAADKTD
ncbi:helix-turn-helix transcriptional regulator [Microbulbifer taiwanensis]|uniref:Helix-turn-helix domain-containing protein n=1 Tax=Microbulbifer taiwanensis TaxID=986746 RepID=A0ABW1YKW9_9GAMM|nr:helix-turn-helix domain-containing protein [Microbulbifer taiwanensis]